MKTFVCLTLFIPALVAADDRLWGTWQGEDPEEPGSLVTLIFHEDGTYEMDSIGAGIDNLFEDLFGEALSDTDMTSEDLAALGFQVPNIIGATLAGDYTVQGDSLSLTLTELFMQVEGRGKIETTRFLLDVLVEIASLQLSDREQTSKQVFFVMAIVFSLFATEMLQAPDVGEFYYEDTSILEGTYLFQEGALVIQSEGFADLVLQPIDGPATAVVSTSWGQIKTRWP